MVTFLEKPEAFMLVDDPNFYISNRERASSYMEKDPNFFCAN
jgi:hypothetical protein